MKITKKFFGDYYTFEDDEIDFVTLHSCKDLLKYYYYYFKYLLIIIGIIFVLAMIVKSLEWLITGKIS